MPPPISTGGWFGPGSVSHSQRITQATAKPPQARAGQTSLTVSSRKQAAVKKAARNGAQPGPGICTRYCGSAWIGPVTMVSRRPVGAPGR
jgi:hypothetical protein